MSNAERRDRSPLKVRVGYGAAIVLAASVIAAHVVVAQDMHLPGSRSPAFIVRHCSSCPT